MQVLSLIGSKYFRVKSSTLSVEQALTFSFLICPNTLYPYCPCLPEQTHGSHPLQQLSTFTRFPDSGQRPDEYIVLAGQVLVCTTLQSL